MMVTDGELAYLLKKIYNKRHIDCTKYKLTTLKRRIDRRLFDTKTKDYYEYASYLDNNPEEYSNFLNNLTINVTNFFRDKEVFDFLKDKVLPELILSKQDTITKRIRIWSAGCAGGEETYSIAMLLYELLGKRIKDYNISIWGTDLDGNSLEQARKGNYDKDMINGVEPRLINKYFIKNGDYKINEKIRSLAKFRKHDLISDIPMKCFDMIFCRNTLIYFNRDFQKKLYMDFYKGLNRRGYLVLGKSETPNFQILNGLECLSKRNCIYRKKEIENN